MSNSNQPGVKTPKSMSSRLLTMKFMQRAAASQSASTTSPDTKSPKSGIQTEDTGSSPSSKRSKLSHTPSQPSTPEFFAPTDSSDVRAALAGAEAMRQAALERSWRGEETKWKFAVRGDTNKQTEEGIRVELLRGRSMDEHVDDADSISRWRTEDGQGRRVFGSKRKHMSSEEATADENDEDSVDSKDSEDSFDLEAEKVLNKPDERLPHRTSGLNSRPNRISGGVQNLDRIRCHGCEEFGHMLRNCPKRGKQRHHQPIGSNRKG